MKHWTADVVPAAGVALLASGVPVALLASVWGGVSLSALGVALLGLYRALDFWQVLTQVQGLVADVKVLTGALAATLAKLDETTKTADTALRAVAAPRKPQAPGY